VLVTRRLSGCEDVPQIISPDTSFVAFMFLIQIIFVYYRRRYIVRSQSTAKQNGQLFFT
jgi:hypothetical protein